MKNRVRELRTEAGMTQQQLADRLHVTRQSVSSWELGRTEPDLQTLTELAEVFGTDAGSLLGEAGRPAYPRLQKRFVTGFVVCAGLLLAVSGLELGLFAYWRKLLLHDYSPALYAALWKLFVPPLLWYASGLGAVCFFAMWSPVRCGKRARLAFFTGAMMLVRASEMASALSVVGLTLAACAMFAAGFFLINRDMSASSLFLTRLLRR